MIVTSPDWKLKVGFYGDDYVLWKIAAYDHDPFYPPRWIITANQNTPAEIVAGLTTVLARDHVEGEQRYLSGPPYYWADGTEPLVDSGWTPAPLDRPTVEFSSPDKQAGLVIARAVDDPHAASRLLWAGPGGWGTHVEITFTPYTPTHLIAATAAAMVDPTPVTRALRQIPRQLRGLLHLTPVAEAQAPPPRAAAATARTTAPGSSTAATTPPPATVPPTPQTRPAHRR
ncbi:DUF317 domain-containing protein [Allostreptomyces psammosilenae]|uniref:Uncharacterized protein YndB with AHSA1/START domain n=1 Tax=Allostreptomyces psammosilenae TaxID=1892865 RepID=A0A852ZQ83_9ACTN|nr:DUF317 domain-containing protein [Allostreptomyces psammosilenae]NYI03430.1 uncharacterized protein YndB with AHSA1/START domain [Allostreptomyces psammosilenae]